MKTRMFVVSLLIGVFAVSLVGCGGSAKTAPATAPADEGPCPAWYTQLPEDPDFFYAASTATSRDLQMALDKAKVGARADLAAQLEIHVEGLTTRFQEEVGLAEEAEILVKYTTATKQVIDQTMVGSRVKETSQKKEGTVWRACVLVDYPVGAANADLVARISQDQALYTRFRDAQTFKQLNEEVAKYREWKAQQGR